MHKEDSFTGIEGLKSFFDSKDGTKNLEIILETIPSAIVLINSDGRFTYVNKRGMELYGINYTGFDMEEHISKVKVQKPDGSPFAFDELPVSHSLKSGQIVRDIEMIIQNVNGIKYLVNVSSAPLYDNSGRISGVIAIFDDFAKRKQAMEELRESEVRIKEEMDGAKLLQSISGELLLGDNIQAIYDKLLDTAVKIMQSDYASIQMLEEKSGSPHELHLLAYRGFSDEAVKSWEWIGVLDATACEALRTSGRVIIPDVKKCGFMQGTDDLKVFLHTGIRAIHTTPLITRSGKIVGMISTQWRKPHKPTDRQLRLFDVLARQAADFIERRQAEEALKESEQKALTLVAELEEADKNKNQFISMLSHELRNPLAAITAGLSLIELTDDKEQILKAKEIIKRQNDQLCKLVDDLLELTRITQNKIVLKKENINLNEIIANAVNDIKPAFQKKGMQLFMKTPKRPMSLYADPVRINQCVSNYLNNALKFTQENGTVWITLKKEKSNAVINVQDNGIGISPDILEQLFKPFVQANHSLDRSENKGLGLGLSIVKSIVEQHGGRVAVSSSGLGKGAMFKMMLPVTEESKNMPEHMDAESVNRVIKI